MKFTSNSHLIAKIFYAKSIYIVHAIYSVNIIKMLQLLKCNKPYDDSGIVF